MMSSQVSTRIFLTRATVSALAILTAVTPGFAAITNTVTVNGSNPAGGAVTATDTESVTPETAAPALTVDKTSSFTDTGPTGVEVGDIISYTYVVTNTGNTFIKNVKLNDVHEGAGTFAQPLLGATPLTDNNTVAGSDSTDDGAVVDGDWDVLAPGDTVTFTASYTVVAADLTSTGASDGDIDNTVTASADYDDGTPTTTPVTNTDTESVPLYLNSSLSVDKSAAPSANVKAGDVITYNYVVTNNGNVPVTKITLTDTDNASGTDPVPAFASLTNTSGNSVNSDPNADEIEVLWPGDSATFTSTYTVNQTDVDTLQ